MIVIATMLSGYLVQVRLLLRDDGPDDHRALAPVLADPECIRMVLHDRLGLVREAAQDVQVLTNESRLDLARIAWAKDELANLRYGVVVVRFQVGLYLTRNGVDPSAVFNVDEQLRIGAVLPFRVCM